MSLSSRQELKYECVSLSAGCLRTVWWTTPFSQHSFLTVMPCFLSRCELKGILPLLITLFPKCLTISAIRRTSLFKNSRNKVNQSKRFFIQYLYFKVASKVWILGDKFLQNGKQVGPQDQTQWFILYYIFSWLLSSVSSEYSMFEYSTWLYRKYKLIIFYTSYKM